MDEIYKEAIEWDIETWKRGIRYWEKSIQQKQFSLQKGLDLGARNGGISFFFAKKYGAHIYCSDYGFPTEKAKALHTLHGLDNLISYHNVDATDIPFEDNTFDFVVFKSILGIIGLKDNYEKQKIALKEIHRVLKPNGVLFFAENSKSSLLHQLARKYFVRWGHKWRYVSEEEMNELLSIFSEKKIKSTGFLAAFTPKPRWLQYIFSNIDKLLFFFPTSWKYVLYGYAIK